MQTYHNKTVQQTAELLGTDIKTGLTHDEVKKRTSPLQAKTTYRKKEKEHIYKIP